MSKTNKIIEKIENISVLKKIDLNKKGKVKLGKKTKKKNYKKKFFKKKN